MYLLRWRLQRISEKFRHKLKIHVVAEQILKYIITLLVVKNTIYLLRRLIKNKRYIWRDNDFFIDECRAAKSMIYSHITPESSVQAIDRYDRPKHSSWDASIPRELWSVNRIYRQPIFFKIPLIQLSDNIETK